MSSMSSHTQCYHNLTVQTPVHIGEDAVMEASVNIATTSVQIQGDKLIAAPKVDQYHFRTVTKVPRTGVMIVGLGGNNGTTLCAGLIANRRNVMWETQIGEQHANWLGSVAMASTTRLGVDVETHADVYVPIRSLVPMVHPDDLVLGGWDINSMDMCEAMRRAQVLPLEVQRAVAEDLSKIHILPGAFDPDFIAANQGERADHCIPGSKAEQLRVLKENIASFRRDNDLQQVIVIWSGNTERFSEHLTGVHDTAENLLRNIESGHAEIAPSLLYAVAAVSEGCPFINGSPQNTFCQGLLEYATSKSVYLGGDDLKTGQTKFKSVMADFLVSSALKPTSICSYNHLGNNDGLNLSSQKQFKSKEITKASVVDDMIASNSILYPSNRDHPDHLIVIKYIPAVGDSKRAIDEYTAKIFMNGSQTFVVHNTCEDSLLAVPIMLDLILFAELFSRITVKGPNDSEFKKMNCLCSLLSLFLKAPQVPRNAPVVNSFFHQREALINFLRASAGLPANDYLSMSHRF